MAGGAYKGLTIRIGADTSSLSSALRGANSAIYKTEGELRKLNKAAKLDPENTDVLKRQIGAISNQAMDAAAKLKTVQTSLSQMSQVDIKAGNLKEVADGTENAALAAENAKDRYNGLTRELATMYTQLSNLSERNFGEEAVKFSFKEGNTDIASISKELDRLAEKYVQTQGKFGLAREEADKFLAEIERTQKVWGEASSALDDANLVQSFKNAESEATVLQATVKGLSVSLANIDSKSSLDKNLSDANERMSMLSAASETATDRFKRLNEAYQLNPLSIGTAVDRAKALAEATDVAKAKAEELRQKIAAYKDAGIDKQASQIGNVATNLEKMKQGYIDATAKVTLLKGELEEAEKAQQSLSDKGMTDLDDEYRNAAKAVEDLKERIKEAEAAQDAAFKDFDTAKACSELEELQTEYRETVAEAKSLSRTDWSGVGTAAVQAAQQVGGLMQRAGSSVVESSNEIDAAYRNLRKTFDAEEADYKRLYDAAMLYSQSHVTSADTMLEMEAIAAQLGVGLQGGADAIQKFAEVSANLDVATDIDAETIALQLGQIVNVMDDLSAEDPDTIEGFADALVRMGNTMPAQESTIMQITQRLSAIGDVAHFTTPQLLGWASAIAATGQRSEAAATGISTTITNISKAVSAGGDDIKKWSDLAGQSAEEFARNWREKPSETLELIIRKLGELGDEGFAELENLDISGVRQTQTLMALAQTVDTVGGAIGRAEDAFNGGGDAAREAEKKAEGFSGALAKMKNSAKVLAAEFGDAMVPYMEKATAAIQKLIDFFDNLDDKTKETTVIVGGLFAGLAVIEPVVEALFGNVQRIVGAFAQNIVTTLAKLNVLGAFDSIGDFGAALQLGFGSALEVAGTKVAAFTKMLGNLVASGNLITGIFGGVALATIFDYGRQFIEAKNRAEKFDDVISGMQGNVEGLATDLFAGSEKVEGYGESWREALDDVNEFMDSMQKHIETSKRTRDEAVQSISELGKYQEVLDEAWGAGEDYDGSYAELQWAIDGLNEVLGTNIQLNDVLNGSYEDEAGVILNTKEAVDQLIASKKQELRLAAVGDIYKEHVAAQAEAEIAYKKANKALSDYVAERKEKLAEVEEYNPNTGQIEKLSEAQVMARIRGEERYRVLSQEAEGLNQILQEEGEMVNTLSNEYDGLYKAAQGSYKVSDDMGERESIMMTTKAIHDLIAANESYGTSAESTQWSIKKIAQGLESVGVDTETFAEFIRDHSDVFGEMVTQADGDIMELVKLVAEFNGIEFDADKFHINGVNYGERESIIMAAQDIYDLIAANEKYGTSAGETQKSIKDIAKGLEEAGVSTETFAAFVSDHSDVFGEMVTQADGDIVELIRLIAEFNGVEFDEKKLTIDGDASGAEEAAEEAKESIEGEEITQEVTGDTSDLEKKAGEAKESIENEPIEQQVVVKQDAQAGDVASSSVTGDVDVSVKPRIDDESLNAVTSFLDDIGENIEVLLSVNADLSEAGETVESLAQIKQDKDIDVNITAKQEGVSTAASNVKKLVDNASKMEDTKAKYTAEGNAATSSTPASNVKALNTASGNMSGKSASYTAGGNAATSDAPATRIWNLVNAIAALPKEKTTTVTVRNVTQNVTPGKSASGAYVPYNKIPRHAAGIFTQPTLTNIGWVGEEGAELYSGNSLIPLTNRKYSMPYINDISDAVARKIGPVDSGPTINITITGVAGPDETAEAIERKLRLLGF